MNAKRAGWGRDAVAYGDPDYQYNDEQTSVGDALANIMHYCDTVGVSFDNALDSAVMHYSAEVSDDDD